MSKTLWPFRMISSKPDTVTIDGEGIHNRMSICRVTMAPDDLKLEIKMDKSNIHKTFRTPSHARESHNDRSEEAEGAIGRIFMHIGTDNSIQYVVSGYRQQP